MALPEGVQSIVAVDVQRAVLVLGTAEGIKNLRQIIDFLDQPVRKVAIDVQTVRLAKEEVKELGLDFQTSATAPAFAGKQNGPALGFVRKNYTQALQKLLDTQRATAQMEVSATITNNLSGFFRVGGPDGDASLIPTYSIQLTPTINNDETVTLAMDSTAQLPGVQVPTDKPRVQIVANVRSGDTIALGSFGGDDSKMASVTFVTARTIKNSTQDDAQK